MKTKTELKKEKNSIYVEMGVYLDSLIRKGELEDAKAVALSKQLHHCEKELFIIEKEANKNNAFKCPSCEKNIEKDTKFCDSCGFNIEEYNSRVIIQCDYCSNELEEGSHFCTVCGKKL